MAKFGPQITMSFDAGADLSTKQYYFVKLNSSGQVVVCAAVTDVPIGVLQNKPSVVGEAATVCILGRTKVSADEALVAGNEIGVSADGQAQVLVVGTETTVRVLGQVTGAAGAAGRLGSAVINCIAPGRAA